jgi:hypothetical protein
VHFLFRFRDLVTTTIDAHSALIASEGRCWWGWWKRPLEPTRLDVWNDLEREIGIHGSVTIGLFHSGKDLVYQATAVKVIKPDESGDAALPALSVPDSERNLVPEYYRNSPYSRAWLQLNKISTPIDFFGKYSLVKAPPLNYPTTFLERFKGKKILDGEELRGMDTTIWEIRPYAAGDNSDRVLASPSLLVEPVSATPIRLTGNTILHITDPHYATGHNRSEHIWQLEGERAGDDRWTLADAILAQVKDKAIGMIVVTGDLTFIGSEEEFIEADRSLNKILGTLNLWHEHIVVIPGNHDIQWTKSGGYIDDAEVNVASTEAKANYAKFFKNLFRYAANDHLSMARRYVFPNGMTMEICGLNSSSLEQGKKFLAGMGRVQESAFVGTSSVLGWKEHDRTLALRVLALHHHLQPTEDIDNPNEFYRGFGMALDSPRVQRLAASRHVQLALHGHKHRAFLSRVSVHSLPQRYNAAQKGSLSIVGGGTAGSPSNAGNENFFSLISVNTDAVDVVFYRSHSKGAFDRMQTARAPISINGLT